MRQTEILIFFWNKVKKMRNGQKYPKCDGTFSYGVLVMVLNNSQLDVFLNIFETFTGFFKSCQEHGLNIFQLGFDFASQSSFHVSHIRFESSHLRGHMLNSSRRSLMVLVQVVQELGVIRDLGLVFTRELVQPVWQRRVWRVGLKKIETST